MEKTKTGRMRNRIIALSAAAFCMIMAASVKEAAAYFTTYVSAGGSHVVNLGSQTKIDEDVKNMVKQISVENTSQINDCYVRVKVFCGDWLKDNLKIFGEDNDLWKYSQQDDYWYYGPILLAGERTKILNVKIEVPEGLDKDSFNVVVIQECAPVIYDEAGNPSADWNTVYSDWNEAQREGAGES